MTVKSTLFYNEMIHIAIAGGNGPGGAAKGRIPNNIFLKKGGFGRASRGRPCLSAFRAKITARRAVFSSDLTSMSKNEPLPWLLVFIMAPGANIKISIFDPAPSVGGTYTFNLYLSYYNLSYISISMKYPSTSSSSSFCQVLEVSVCSISM